MRGCPNEEDRQHEPRALHRERHTARRPSTTRSCVSWATSSSRGALGLEDAPAGNRQCVILSAASEEGRAGKHDRYSPASFHEERRCHEYAAPSVVRFWFLLGIRVLR
jgi:hypothetical protein